LHSCWPLPSNRGSQAAVGCRRNNRQLEVSSKEEPA
jgi:hypothetical protein